MKVALYARVSTHDQDETLQLPRLREYAARVGGEVVAEYSDEATGKNRNRPGWLALMSDARRHNFDRILITKLDRAMRSIRLLLDDLEQLQAYEIQIVTPELGVLDLKSPGSRLLLTVLGSIAEWEGETISVRTKEGLAARKARGQTLGRPALELPIHEMALLRLSGNRWADIARATRVNISTVRAHKGEIEAEADKIREQMAEPTSELRGLEMSRLI